MMIRLNWACVKVKASIIGTARSASPAPLLSPSISRTRSASVERAEVVRKARPQRPSLSARDFPATGLKSLRSTSGAIGAPMSPAPSAPAAASPALPSASATERRRSSPPRVLLSFRARTAGSV